MVILSQSDSSVILTTSSNHRMTFENRFLSLSWLFYSEYTTNERHRNYSSQPTCRWGFFKTLSVLCTDIRNIKFSACRFDGLSLGNIYKQRLPLRYVFIPPTLFELRGGWQRMLIYSLLQLFSRGSSEVYLLWKCGRTMLIRDQFLYLLETWHDFFSTFYGVPWFPNFWVSETALI